MLQDASALTRNCKRTCEAARSSAVIKPSRSRFMQRPHYSELRRPTAFAQFRHVAVIHGQREISVRSRKTMDCVEVCPVDCSAAVSVAGKRLFRQQRQLGVKPLTASDNRDCRDRPLSPNPATSRSFTVSSGNLRSTVNAWWGWEDSNFQPKRLSAPG